MDDTTARLGLPLLQPGQAQKERDHNEALAALDLATQASVVSVGVDLPPATPAIGACWIVGAAPGGAWAGHAGALAGWTAGGWRFVGPREGMGVWSAAEGSPARYRGGQWRVGELAQPQPAIAEPSGGSTVDQRARTAVASILAALRHHGLIAPG